MKKPFLTIIAIAVIPAFFMGCGTTKPAETEVSDESFIWRLLRSGDEKAMGYFHGEFDANITDSEGKTPLHYSVSNNNAALTRFFLSQGANPNVVDGENQSPLGIAVKNNYSACIEALASSGADIHLPILDDTTAAVMALSQGGPAFRSLLFPATVNTSDSSGKTILHLAAIEGNARAAELIMSISSSSAYVNKTDKENKNALEYALSRPDSLAHIETAEQIILNGGFCDNSIFTWFGPAARSGNYNLRRNEGLTPLHHAIIGNYTGLISFLIDKDTDINLKSASGASPLHEAARAGNIPVIELLILKGADVNSQDAKGNTPLHTGIPLDVHIDAIAILIDNGADPNIRDEHGETPLHIAITLDRPVNVIQALLNCGSDVHIRNIKGQTPLYIAVFEKRTNLIPLLLSYGAELFAADNTGVTPFDIAFRVNSGLFNLLVTEETVNQRDTAGNTLLHATVRNRGSSEQIGKILDQRPLIDAVNRAGDSALHIAVKTNQRASGEYLIARGADIFLNNADGESPLYLALTASSGIRQWMINPATVQAKDGLGNNMLHYAAQWNLTSAIPLIIRGGVSVNEANATGETPIFMAVKADSAQTIRILNDHNANLNARDAQGNSLLHASVRWNSLSSARLLIASGMDVNAFNLNGNTPLHDAVSLGMSDIETLLINEKANLEARNIDGNTPLMEAVKAGFIPSIEKLVSAGADPSTRNTRGDTPLHIAVSMEQLDIVRALLRMRVSIHALNTRNRTPFQTAITVSEEMVRTLLTRDRINQPDDMGSSALHIAVQENAPQNILRAILRAGARINAVDSNGKTPLRVAVDLQMWETVKLLADNGANPFMAAVDTKTPADLAFEKGDECLRALFSGSSINARDSSENTILHLAARYGNPSSIRALLELGANKNARNISSELPYEIAVRWNRNDNAEILR